ncbi:MAG: hypothetical protein PHE17_04050 [Thiothrix sp.]|uniref:hypothetical protein n=1 Tax=Thiothrix sp. TaxID=1032 RepID=UPI00260D448D|nr:hypothetical protein [Thiothrix sp.]MDD5392174.1 hypothetical protein [Thiothrix sp.]
MKKGMTIKPVLALAAGVLLFAAPLMSHAALSMPADSKLIYRVQGMSAGNVLKMYQEPGKNVIVNIPHNATWIVRRNGQKTVDKVVWEKVSWDDQTGWVVSDALVHDPEATDVANARRQCMADPKVQDKECCGYPEAAKGGVFRSVPIYSVQELTPGESLMMYVDQGNDAIAVEIPHNATWVAKLGKMGKAGKLSLERVRWAGQNGWVNAANLKFDPDTTKEGDRKRQKCGGMTTGEVDFRKSDVVCLPAPVIRRLQESGALDAATVDKLKAEGNK